MRQAGNAAINAYMQFQFTHPGRGATVYAHQAMKKDLVSIHAPREGCDTSTRLCSTLVARFNSRTPGGVRLNGVDYRTSSLQFQFTHPGRGATQGPHIRVGLQRRFNSRTPGGVRR